MRLLLLALPLLFPVGAFSQPTASFAEGLLTITGTDGDDFLTVGCAEGMAQLDGTDVPGAACGDVQRIDLDLSGGLNNATLTTLADFALDPTNPGEFRGGDDLDVLDLDLTDHTGNLTLSIRPPSGAGRTAAGRADHRSELYVADVGPVIPTDLYAFVVHDETGVGIVFATGPGDDTVEIDPAFTGRPLESLTVFGGLGSDAMDLSALSASITAGLEVAFNGQEGDDRFSAPPTGGVIGWAPGGGTDRFTPGPGPDGVTVFGSGAAPLTIHEIRGFLGTECSFFDFGGGGGVLLDGPERVERVRYFMPPTVGGDVFSELECGGVTRDLGWGNSGDDQFYARGPSGGGTRVDIDFPEGLMEIFADGFESGDVSAWSTSAPRVAGGALRSGDDVLWDGIEYQDWPSFADPATSGPSTVIVRGKPDFPVTIALGPDGGTTRGGGDTLRVDPLGLSVTDDGSQIVIDGGPPISYSGVEAVEIVSATAPERTPLAVRPTLTAYPNPTARSVRVRLQVEASVDAHLVVVDALGREVLVLHDGPVAAGAREWALEDGRVAPGLYLVHARGPGWTASQPIVVVE